MEAPPAPSLHQHVSLPPLTSLIRLLPLCLLFFLTSPHGLADHIHAFYTRRPYAKPSPRDAFPSKAGDINLSELIIRLNTSSHHANLILGPGTSLYASIRAPALCTLEAPCVALVEAWYDPHLPREDKPDPYLLAANGTIPQPFPHYPPSLLADDEAFYTWRPYHYVSISSMTAHDIWHLRLFNHDSTVFNMLNATLRVTVARDAKRPLCPRGAGRSACSGLGKCVLGACQCNDGHGGRFCETVVEDLPPTEIEVPPDGMRVFRYHAPRRAHVVTEMRLLPPQAVTSAAHPILFAKRYGENGGRLLAQGPPLPTIYDALFTDAMAVRAHMSTQRVVTHDVLKDHTVYIAVYNFRASAPAWLVRRHPNLRASALMQRRAVRVALRVYPCADEVMGALPLLAQQLDAQQAHVSQSAHRVHGANHTNPMSDGATLRRCPSRPTDWGSSMSILLGPLLLISLTLMTMVVCVSVWAGVFRQHMYEAMGLQVDGVTALHPGGGGPVNGTLGAVLLAEATGNNTGMSPDRDKLSQEEVNAMFPSFEFTKRVTEAVGAAGDASCSVCLCAFEEGEQLRRLPCGHSYHSHCLDRWLITNASCPRCRMKARISGEVLARPRLSARFASVRSAVGSAFGMMWSALRLNNGRSATGSSAGENSRASGRRDGHGDELIHLGRGDNFNNSHLDSGGDFSHSRENSRFRADPSSSVSSV